MQIFIDILDLEVIGPERRYKTLLNEGMSALGWGCITLHDKVKIEKSSW